MKRQSMSRRSSRKTFRRGAKRTHSKNKMNSVFMRGGIRL